MTANVLLFLLRLLGSEVDETQVLVVETFDGQVFEAGSGDTCPDAFKNAVFPDDWRSLRCEAAYLVR